MPKKRLRGIVVSDKMKKTVVVEVERIKQHPKYLKRYKVHKRYKAHDENEKRKLGDKVLIEECRPMSRDKRWKVIKNQKSKIKSQNSSKAPKALKAPKAFVTE